MTAPTFDITAIIVRILLLADALLAVGVALAFFPKLHTTFASSFKTNRRHQKILNVVKDTLSSARRKKKTSQRTVTGTIFRKGIVADDNQK